MEEKFMREALRLARMVGDADVRAALEAYATYVVDRTK